MALEVGRPTSKPRGRFRGWLFIACDGGGGWGVGDGDILRNRRRGSQWGVASTADCQFFSNFDGKRLKFRAFDS